MGILNKDLLHPTIELVFPACWSKVTTALKDISPKREIFLYTATHYDELIDTPIEIGCHLTDGFRVFDTDHDVAIYGHALPFKDTIKSDTKKSLSILQVFSEVYPTKNTLSSLIFLLDCMVG